MKIVLKKVYVIEQIFHCRPSKQFPYQISYCVMENSLQNLVNVVKKWQLIFAYLLKHQNRNEFERIYPTIAIAERIAGAISYIVITIVGSVWMNPLSTAQPITQWLVHTIEFSHNTQSWQYWHLIQMHRTIFKEWNIILFPPKSWWIHSKEFIFVPKAQCIFFIGVFDKKQIF